MRKPVRITRCRFQVRVRVTLTLFTEEKARAITRTSSTWLPYCSSPATTWKQQFGSDNLENGGGGEGAGGKNVK